MDSSVSAKDEIWFLRVCHHVSNAVYAAYSVAGTVPRLWAESSLVGIPVSTRDFSLFQNDH